MKKHLLFFILFLSFRLFGQEVKTDTLPDFTKMNMDINQRVLSPPTIRNIDTIIDFFGEENWDTDFEIVSDDLIINKRRYFPNSKIIHKEFIRLNDFKYHYLENDSLNDNRLMAKGDFVVSKDVPMSIDTIEFIDPQTYESFARIIKHPKLLKDGEWFEADSVFLYGGHYKNDKREGKWTKHRRQEGIEEAELVYKDGILISSELNLVSKHDTNGIKAVLIGKWCVQTENHQSDIFNLSKSGCPSRFYYQFNANGTFEFLIGTSLMQEGDNLDTWKINKQFQLEHGDYKTGRIRRYKLLLVRQNVVQLRML